MNSEISELKKEVESLKEDVATLKEFLRIMMIVLDNTVPPSETMKTILDDSTIDTYPPSVQLRIRHLLRLICG